MPLPDFLPPLEAALKQAVERVSGPEVGELRQMLAYHMGWEGPGAGPQAQGKRLRPQLVLLTTSAAGGDWQSALPAAVAVELVHNFSLIHDDIEDSSPLRHGRPTLWERWGVAQAVNAGDAMFSLAHLALLDLDRSVPAAVTVAAARLLHETCLHLTQGQYLDISYQDRGDLHPGAYWPMVGGKTAALISACTRLGALVAGSAEARCEAYTRFGRCLGLAFQAQDDLLGIWGDAALTGKSAESDLVSGKKSLPVLFGLERQGEFARRWAQGPVLPAEVPALADLLAREGAYEATRERANALTEEALDALEAAAPGGEAGQALQNMALRLMQREK
jgi:geranylgeranyl diphosphate synthase type I